MYLFVWCFLSVVVLLLLRWAKTRIWQKQKKHNYCIIWGKKSVRYVAERIGRSKTAVHNVLSTLKSESNSNRPGPKPKITKTQDRAIIRAAFNGARTAREIRGSYNCSESGHRIQQVLRNALHQKYKKMQTGPCLSPKHKEVHIKWAKNYCHWRTRWCCVTFCD